MTGATDWPQTSTRRQSIQRAKPRRFANADGIGHDQDGAMQERINAPGDMQRELERRRAEAPDIEPSMSRQGS